MLGFLFRIVFCLFLIIFVWEEYDKTKSSFDVGKGYEDVGGVGVKFCVCARGLSKIGEVKGSALYLATELRA